MIIPPIIPITTHDCEPLLAAVPPVVACCECGHDAGVDYNVRDGKPYCFPCFYAEEGGE